MTSQATPSAAPQTLTIRELRGSEYAATLPLARAIWGDTDQPEDTVLLHMLRQIGGLVAGAVDEQGRLWAYLVAFPTARQGVQHSHRMGVHPAVRQQHLGERLKRFQRDWCLERGIRQVNWTFDPLLAVNAHLNVHRLGALVGTYLPDHYGQMQNISAGAPSDRFEAVWKLDSERVSAHLAGEVDLLWPDTPPIDPLTDDLPATLPDALSVRVPDQDYYALLRDDPAGANLWRSRTRPLFTRLFEQGFVLTDVDLKRRLYLLQRNPPC